jgi:hypothetical protein
LTSHRIVGDYEAKYVDAPRVTDSGRLEGVKIQFSTEERRTYKVPKLFGDFLHILDRVFLLVVNASCMHVRDESILEAVYFPIRKASGELPVQFEHDLRPFGWVNYDETLSMGKGPIQ